MASASREEVKVVLIETRHVVTDAMSFKSVVQSLTGKDSCVAWIEESSFAGAKTKRPANRKVGVERSGKNGARDDAAGGGDWRLSKGSSFKDLDKMMLDLPPMEEWKQLWLENNLR